jgi:hypothetical protein
MRFTLDGNEQYQDVDGFRILWNRLRGDARLSASFSKLVFVEQPFTGRSHWVTRSAARCAPGPDRPPMIIDESDATLASLPRALACGYVGTSHKNCKGVFKGIANGALIAQLRREHPGRIFVQSAEDLTTIGPVALQQDLAVVANLGIDHLERNGHHYFAD